MPALILQIVQFISLAVSSAPEIKKVYEDGKALAQSLFSAGLITAAQQDAVMTWADAHQAAVLAGQVPPEFTVQ